MSRILLAWELGTGVGHLAAFRTVAEALLARGHQLTLAARDTGSAAMVFGGLPVLIVQAPICVKTYNSLTDPPLNFSEILMRFGYLDSTMLQGLLQGWRSLLELTQADRLVADHAPTALLAARERGIARITFGNPFSVPPAVSPTPNMRDWLTVPAQRLQNSDAAVVAAINSVLMKSTPPMVHVHEIFDDADRLFVGIPALDPYGARSPEHYLGLNSASSGSAAINWPAGDGPRLFAYLRTDYPHIDACLRAIAEGTARCLVNLAGANPEFIARYGSARLQFSTGHVDMATVAGQCDAALCHGGLGTVNAMLRAGKPLLLLPAQLEQYLLACNVEKLGAGLTVHPETAKPDFAGALHSLLTDARFGKNALSVAQRHSLPSLQQMIAHAVARIEAVGTEAVA